MVTTDKVTCAIRNTRTAESTKVCSRGRAKRTQRNLHQNNQHACASTCMIYTHMRIYSRRIRAEIVRVPDATIIRNQVSRSSVFSGPTTRAFYLASVKRTNGRASAETSSTLHVVMNFCPSLTSSIIVIKEWHRRKVKLFCNFSQQAHHANIVSRLFLEN